MGSGLAPAAVPLQQQALLSRFLLRLQGPVYNPKRDAPGDDSRLQHHFPWLATSLKGLSPYEYICSTWTKESGRFRRLGSRSATAGKGQNRKPTSTAMRFR